MREAGEDGDGGGVRPRASGMASDADGGGEPEAGTSLEAPERPLVVFCRKCNTILGDTNTFVCTHPALKTITLGGKGSRSRHGGPGAAPLAPHTPTPFPCLTLCTLSFAHCSRVFGHVEEGRGGDAAGGRGAGKVRPYLSSLALAFFSAPSLTLAPPVLSLSLSLFLSLSFSLSLF